MMKHRLKLIGIILQTSITIDTLLRSFHSRVLTVEHLFRSRR